MPRRATAVLLGIACLSASGCFLAHERGLGAREVDAGRTTVIDAAPRPADAGPPIVTADAGAPLACPLARPEATCLASFLIPPGRPFELPYDFDQCGCCVHTECAVAVDAAARTLSLTTTLCPDPCDCDACYPTAGTCLVPALETGIWQVISNGVAAFELPVMPDSAEVPPPPGCATYATGDHCAPSSPLAGHPVVPNGQCIVQRPSRQTGEAIVIVDHCSSCTLLDGPCYGSLTERLTDDLPRGGDLHLVSYAYGTSCDVDCPGVCVERERECIVPRLVPGDTYRVFMNEQIVATFVAGVATGCI